MSSALFGNAARASSKHLVEFKAGKMNLKGKMVHADTRKGLVYIYQSDDSLVHFCWKDRSSGSVEEDLIIFPDDCEYKAIPQCKDGRAFVLKFKSTPRRLFFWMQESSSSKDDEYVRKINDLLNNPPAPGSQSSSRLAGALGSSASAQALLGSDLRDSDLQNLIGNISQQQLLQILGSGVMGGSTTTGSSRTTTTTATPTTAPTSTPVSTTSSTTTSSSTASKASSGTPRAPIQLSDLQNILSGMGPSPQVEKPEVDLSLGLTAEALQPLLSDPAFVSSLAPHLPKDSTAMPPAEQLRGTVTCPQFKQAVALFSHALGTGQLGPLVAQFGLGDEAVAAASGADMEAFVKALGKKDAKDKETKKDDKDTEDEKMNVD